MSTVKRFYDVTLKLISFLEAAKDRDEKISVVEQLLEERQDLMTSMSPPYSEDEKEIGAQLLKLNQKLTALLEKEKLLIQKDIKGLSVKKQSTNKYVNPYQSMAVDGVFYDKRK